jgi:hypothetical protein
VAYLLYFRGEDYSKCVFELDDYVVWKFSKELSRNEFVELAISRSKETDLVERLEFGYENDDTIRMFGLKRATSGEISLHSLNMRGRPNSSTRRKILKTVNEWIRHINPKNEDLNEFHMRLLEEI